MKAKLFPFITLFLLISNLIFSQSITFDKDYPSLAFESEGYIVEQTSDGSFIIGGVANAKLIIVKTDSLGELIFSKEFERNKDLKGLRTFPVHVTNDGGFIVTSGKPSANGSDLFLAKLDADGNIVWENTYPANQFVFGSDVVETDDGDFIAIGYVERNIVSLTKTDSDGNLIWSKSIEFNPTTAPLTGPILTKLSDGNYLLANDKVLQKFNTDGDSLWQINSGFKVSSIKQTRFGRMIASGYRKFAVINLDGIVEYEQSLGFTVVAGDNAIDKGYIFLANGNTITKTDSLGEIEWEKNLIGTGNYIVSTSDGGYAVTGNYIDNLRLLKTDNTGEFEAIYIVKPVSYKSLAIFQEHVIEWYSNGVENVDIEYSIDNGVNWFEVVSNYPADSNKYSWFVPNTPSENCNLRIKASNNSDVYHMLDTVFTIMQIQNYDYIAINECKMWIGNNGMSAHNPITDDSGFFWPGGEDAEIAAIFADGLVWGCKLDGDIRVNGNTYRYGLQPGQILENGQPDNPKQSKYKIFKINKNWESLPEGPIKDRLEYDYNNWPGELGAPYNDVNGDGVFTKGTDTPKFIGDEVLFYVANDKDTTSSRFTYGSDPIGLEFQTTVWAFDTDDFLKDVVFKKYRMINKSGKQLDDFFFTYWMDDDLGFAGDDFVGCDTLLSLAYSWNGDNNDNNYYGENPPAVGHLLLQGPKTTQDHFDAEQHEDKWLPDGYNLPITSSFLYLSGSYHYMDPSLGDIEGTIEFYNNMQGLLWNGDPITFIINPDPITRDTTKFVTPGNPVEETGWYEGEGWPGGPEPGDRRSLLTSGSVTVAPGDTQEVVFAIFMARGSDNVQSVAELKNTAESIHLFYGNEILVDVENENNITPTQFSLSQNYPNPFNPSTTIKYSIPSSSVILSAAKNLQDFSSQSSQVNGAPQNDNHNVSLILYDILGRKVKTLVNQKQAPGNYEVEFNASKLASGMYFYRLNVGASTGLSADKAGSATNNFVAVKKMMFLK